MIVGSDTSLLELTGFFITELPEGDADLHAELADFADCFEHRVEAAISRFHSFPGGSHAEAGGSAIACLLCQG